MSETYAEALVLFGISGGLVRKMAANLGNDAGIVGAAIAVEEEASPR